MDINIKIYRYEKTDGGGPFMTRDGVLRHNPDIVINDDYLCGCLSLESLFKYFKDYQDIIKDCLIAVYNIPKNEITIVSEREVNFPKKYSPIYFL